MISNNCPKEFYKPLPDLIILNNVHCDRYAMLRDKAPRPFPRHQLYEVRSHHFSSEAQTLSAKALLQTIGTAPPLKTVTAHQVCDTDCRDESAQCAQTYAK